MEETRADPHMKSGKCNFPRLCSISAAVTNAFSRKIYHVDNFSLMFSVVASEHGIQLGFRVSQGSAEPEGIWTVQTVQTCVVSLWFCSCFVSKERNSHSKPSRRTSALSLLSCSWCDFLNSVGQRLTAEVWQLSQRLLQRWSAASGMPGTVGITPDCDSGSPEKHCPKGCQHLKASPEHRRGMPKINIFFREMLSLNVRAGKQRVKWLIYFQFLFTVQVKVKRILQWDSLEVEMLSWK